MHYQNFEMQLELFSNHCRKTNETGNEYEASNQSANYVTRSNGGKKMPCTLYKVTYAASAGKHKKLFVYDRLKE